MAYNYLESVTQDCEERIMELVENDELSTNAKDYDNDGFDSYIEDLKEELHDNLWVDDSVTGNASGSYTMNRYQAEENLAHNLDLLVEACREFGSDVGEVIEKGAESADVTIRCYVLSESIDNAIKSLEDKLQEHFQEVQNEKEKEDMELD